MVIELGKRTYIYVTGQVGVWHTLKQVRLVKILK